MESPNTLGHSSKARLPHRKVCKPSRPSRSGLSLQSIDEIDHRKEAAAGATTDASPSDGDRKMAFAGAGATDQNSIALCGNKSATCPLDRVNREFRAPCPNRLWVSDFTYVSTWQGFVYVAFIIDVFARYIVGLRASRTAHTAFVLDALEQALYQRRRQLR